MYIQFRVKILIRIIFTFILTYFEKIYIKYICRTICYSEDRDRKKTVGKIITYSNHINFTFR